MTLCIMFQLGRAWASPTLVRVHCPRVSVCCLDRPLTEYYKSVDFTCTCQIQWTITVSSLPAQWTMAPTKTETTGGPTYSLARATRQRLLADLGGRGWRTRYRLLQLTLTWLTAVICTSECMFSVIISVAYYAHCSFTFWWHAALCSARACTCSGSPHKVLHSTSTSAGSRLKPQIINEQFKNLNFLSGC